MKRKLVIGLMLFLLCGAVVFGAALTRDMRQKLENIRTASSVYDRNGKLIANLYSYNRIWVSSDKMTKDLRNAVVAIEDNRFYQHNGIDVRGMARAVVRDLIPGGGMEGGSTITQQLAKIALLSSERTINRKIQDITLALEIEQVYTKKEILEMYLNSVYLAHGNVGVEAAARYYFGKSASQLTLAESATIAGMIQSPENYSPHKHPDACKSRRNLVLNALLEQKYITKKQYDTAKAQPLRAVGRNEAAPASGYFLDYVKEYLIKQEDYSEEQLRFGGYKIYTTLDLSLQKAAEQTMAQIPKATTKVQPQGALVTLNPADGAILAMVGGRNYGESQYNRATKAYRQPGSTIKPFVYATALEKGFTAASVLEDKPLEIPVPSGEPWRPRNYDNQFRGPLTLREGLRNSVNIIAVQLLQQIGVESVVEQMERMGVTSLVKQGENNDLGLAPLALGGLTKGVTPLELAASYAVFANQGNYFKPYPVKRIVDRHGNPLKQYGPAQPKPALSAPTAYIMTVLMQDVIDRGTGVRAKLGDRPAAGKTGTTTSNTNAWFVGYTPELVTAIWLGNDRQDQAMTFGSGVAAELWGSYMRRTDSKKAASEFPEPPGVVWAKVDPKTGQAVPNWFGGDTYLEVFSERNVPSGTAYKMWRWFFGTGRKKAAESKPAPGPEPNQGAQFPQGY